MHVQWLLYGDRESEIILEEKDKEGGAILVVSKHGAGEIIATTIHEYPSERFIAYCVEKC